MSKSHSNCFWFLHGGEGRVGRAKTVPDDFVILDLLTTLLPFELSFQPHL